ncbi:glycerophosphodiester phosphodiesterase [Ureibacillus manganicus]|uniref:Glycerophosphodiester phosphodiesterase n=1 Tax=Ureibacillus manganicus DSM 26584 TaxID=1384049 RepID=A0A0A3I4F2_9BACL|nr:glycerophosphodiester phosphodiesterase family protein [Ureibacillus manganicus]KGR78380.1 glycerophosphodiester phosphodiesterase [Ureibacillus manganicus DSM 26584]
MYRNISIFAHRGASGYEVENTFAAFEKARKLEASGIELDVQITKDQVLVVFHDVNLSRLAGVNKSILDCTFDELCELRIGKRFFRKFTNHKIPSLHQVVEWANKHQVPLNIELKETVLENTNILVEVLQTLNLPKGSHFSSFHDELMKIVKMQRPDFETAILVTKKFNWEQLNKMSHIDAVHAHKRFYKTLYLEYCKKANKKVRFYSIIGTELFLASPDTSVVGWITDYPDKVLKKL